MNADDAPCSMDPSCHFWIAKNFVSDKREYRHAQRLATSRLTSLPWQVYFSNPLPPAVQAHLVGTPTAPKASFMSFPAEPGGYFAKHAVGDGWSTDLLPVYEDALLATRQQVGERAFDTALRRVLFGRNGTHVIVFETGFIAKLQGSCVRLSEALREFNEPGWSLDEGSALSVHNEDHYFLKFSRKGVQGVQIRANMPQFMEAKFIQLMEEAKNPDEALGELCELFDAFVTFLIHSPELAKEQELIRVCLRSVVY